MNHPDLLVAIVVVALLAIAGFLLYRRNESKRLRARFGPEYARAVEQHGSAAKAERELLKRERRVGKLKLVSLSAAEAVRFRDGWRSLQARFVDDPAGAVAGADALVQELMIKRGYPMADFDGRAADISVDHPRVVEHYRRARVIAERARRGAADTEELRRAVVHYRTLFDDLCETDADVPPQRDPAVAARP